MLFEERLAEINNILDCTTEKEKEDWTIDHSIWFVAWLIHEFGEEIVSGMLTEEDGNGPKVTAKDASEKMAFILKPPGFVVDTPFPNSWDMWWQSVADLINKGKVAGKDGKPNYEGAMRGWKNRVKEQYGFRPTRTKERSMTQHIKDMVSGSSKIISSKRKGMHIPKEVIKKAAKLMQGAKIQRQRKKEYERLQTALRPGHETAVKTR